MKTRATTELVPLKDIAAQEMREALLTGEILAILPGVDDIGVILMFCCSFNISIPIILCLL